MVLSSRNLVPWSPGDGGRLPTADIFGDIHYVNPKDVSYISLYHRITTYIYIVDLFVISQQHQ